jgi:hypothetical protein
MVWLRSALLATVVVCWPAVFAQDQDEVPIQEEPNYEFVSGIITDLPPGKIVVNRALIGKPVESRTFLLTSETKIEGKLRPKVRVTVGFKPSDEGDVAVRVIVRGQSHPAQPKKP